MQLTIIGTGFVGVVSAAVYASLGNQVIGLDIDEAKVTKLKNSQVPFYEPGLPELLQEQQAAGRLTFTTSYAEAIPSADAIVIAVGTPSLPSGEADLQYVWKACDSLAPLLTDQAIVAIKSTVPPGTLGEVFERIQSQTEVAFQVASLPEFLREGKAVSDSLHPDRVVIGADTPQVADQLRQLHEPLKAPIIVMSPSSAQMTKYAANTYLANRITFINEIADICETNEADVEDVIKGIGFDRRIGSEYWYPGFGYGGSCFPKDVNELQTYASKVGLTDTLFHHLHTYNTQRIERRLAHYGQAVGGWQDKTVAVLGLSFKPHTNDMREAPSLTIIPALLKSGATVQAFDPQAVEEAQALLPTDSQLSFHQSLTQATQSASVIMALIEWPEIVEFDFSQVRNPAQEQWFIDARNQFEPDLVAGWGFTYLGVGR